MLKVLHFVTKMDRAGQETFIMNLYRKIDRGSIQFNFLCTNKEPAHYDEEILSLGGKIFYTEETTKKGILKQIKKFLKLERDLKELHDYCDVFHIHTHHAMDAFRDVIAAKMAGIKIIVVHSHNTNTLYHIHAHYFFRMLLSWLDIKRFACSVEAGQWMFRKQNFKVICNGLDIDKFRFNEKKRSLVRKKLVWEDNKIIGHIGRFNRQKNHVFLIEIFKIIHERCPDTKLVLVGTGELEKEIKELVQSMNLVNSVDFLGIREDVSELYQGMDLFLFPSLFEGLPVVLIEAQACDVPCVISDSISPDAILVNNTSTMSLLDSKEDWASKCIDILNGSSKRMDRSEEISAGGYNISDLAKKLEQTYLA